VLGTREDGCPAQVVMQSINSALAHLGSVQALGSLHSAHMGKGYLLPSAHHSNVNPSGNPYVSQLPWHPQASQLAM
jgi:hypothetical protein